MAGSRAPTPTPQVARRREILEGLVDLGSGVGLEIGPLDSPLVTAPPRNVRYVDVFDTAALREHHRPNPVISVEHIVEVDFPLRVGTTTRTLAEAAAQGAPYAWAVASHVIEHVPDLVGWLADVADVLEDHGQLFLIVPDRRFTFDAARPATTTGQLLEAHSRAETVPSERAVFDYFRSATDLSAAQLWAGGNATEAPRRHAIEEAASHREAALRGEYVDSHVWVFSPAEFLDQIVDLGDLDLCHLIVEHIRPTALGDIEFAVVLRRLPRRATMEERAALRDTSLSAIDRSSLNAPHGHAAVAPAATVALSAFEVRLIRIKREVGRRLGARARRLRSTLRT